MRPELRRWIPSLRTTICHRSTSCGLSADRVVTCQSGRVHLRLCDRSSYTCPPPTLKGDPVVQLSEAFNEPRQREVDGRRHLVTEGLDLPVLKKQLGASTIPDLLKLNRSAWITGFDGGLVAQELRSSSAPARSPTCSSSTGPPGSPGSTAASSPRSSRSSSAPARSRPAQAQPVRLDHRVRRRPRRPGAQEAARRQHDPRPAQAQPVRLDHRVRRRPRRPELKKQLGASTIPDLLKLNRSAWITGFDGRPRRPGAQEAARRCLSRYQGFRDHRSAAPTSVRPHDRRDRATSCRRLRPHGRSHDTVLGKIQRADSSTTLDDLALCRGRRELLGPVAFSRGRRRIPSPGRSDAHR